MLGAWTLGHLPRIPLLVALAFSSSFVVELLPGDLDPDAASWVGEGSGLEKIAVVGEGPRAISVYRTSRPVS